MKKKQLQSSLRTLRDAASVCRSTTAVFLDAVKFAGQPADRQSPGEQARIAERARAGMARMKKISPRLTKLSASLKGFAMPPELRQALTEAAAAYAAFSVARASWEAIAALHPASQPSQR